MSSPIPVRWRTFRLVKAGNAAEEYEDADAADISRRRFAIADGAAEASFAGDWARLLVEGFVAEEGKPWQSLDWLQPIRRQWAAIVGDFALPWYAEEKRQLGAFATFLGLVFQRHKASSRTIWRARSIGDSCLFHTRAGRLLKSFPLTQSDEFGNRPRLLRSRPHETDSPHDSWTKARGICHPSDRLLLMTDALAQWFLLHSKRKKIH